MKFYSAFLTVLCLLFTTTYSMEESWCYKQRDHGLYSLIMSEKLYDRKYPCFNMHDDRELSSFGDILSWSGAMRDANKLLPDVTNKVLDICYCLSVCNTDPQLLDIISKHYDIPRVQYHCLGNNQKQALMYIGSCIQEAVKEGDIFCLKAEGFGNYSSNKIYEHIYGMPLRIKEKIAAKDGNCIFVKTKDPSFFNVCMGQGIDRINNLDFFSNRVAYSSYCITQAICFLSFFNWMSPYMQAPSLPEKKGIVVAELMNGSFFGFLMVMIACKLQIRRVDLAFWLSSGSFLGVVLGSHIAKAKRIEFSKSKILAAASAGSILTYNCTKPGDLVFYCVKKSFSETLIESMIASGFEPKPLLLEHTM